MCVALSLKRFVCATALLASVGCAKTVPWSNHISLRSYARAASLSNVDPEDLIASGIIKDHHYVSLSFDALAFREVPGMSGRRVAIGVEVSGGGMPSTRTIWGVGEPRGRSGSFSARGAAPLTIGPFGYDGSEVRISLWLKSLGRGRAELAALARADSLSPSDAPLRALSQRVFDSVMAMGAPAWKYHFTLRPRAAGGAPSTQLTAGQHVLLFAAPSERAKDIASPTEYRPFIAVRGDRVVWRHDGREFNALPYLVFRVTRHRRGHAADAPLRRARADLERAFNAEDVLGSGALVAKLRTLTDDAPLIARERRLWRDVAAADEERVRVLSAARDGHKSNQLLFILAELRALANIMREHTLLLESAEIKALDARIQRAVAEYERVARMTGSSLHPLTEAISRLRDTVERAKRIARDTELGRLRFAMKYDVGRKKPEPPPAHLLRD